MSQEEDEFWSGKILEARHGQLDTVRKAAASWSALFTVVLGVFSTVTFVSGLDGLDDLGVSSRALVRIGIVIAAVATLAATVLAGSAANCIPIVTNDVTITTFQTENKKKANNALRRLRVAMGLGAFAAVVVVAGSLIVLFSDSPAAPAKPPTLVAVVDGKTYCGVPVESADGTLSLGSISLDGATSLTVVQACPKKP